MSISPVLSVKDLNVRFNTENGVVLSLIHISEPTRPY